MSIANLKKDLDAIIERRSNMFVFAHSDPAAPSRSNVSAAYSLGEVADAKLTFSAKKTRRSTTGKSKTTGYDVKVVFLMMQTSDVEFKAIPGLMSENDIGTTLKASNGPCGVANALTTPGLIFENIGVSVDGELDLGGADSFFTVTAEGYCSVADIANLGTQQSAPYATGERKITFDGC